MKSSPNFLTATRTLAVLALMGLQTSSWAQKQPVLKGAQVTEDALVDALAIDAPTADGTAKSRGFGPSPSARPPSKPAGPGKANLMITFLTGSAELTPESTRLLDTVAKALQTDTLAGFTFRVEGHADPRGLVDRNLSLSEQRAQAVVSYLVSKGSILPERLAAVGKGSSELYDTKRPDAPENRRVTIVTTR